MGIFDYGQFKGAEIAETPEFATAAARQGQVDSEAKARVNALRSRNTMGGLRMGENAFKNRDAISSWFGGGAEPAVEMGAQLNAPTSATPFAADTGASMDAMLNAPIGAETLSSGVGSELATGSAELIGSEAAAAGMTAAEIAAAEAATAEAASLAAEAGATASASSTPWGAIIAAGMQYDKGAAAAGRRDDMDAVDYLTGKPAIEDMNALSDKLFTEEDQFGLGHDMKGATSLMEGDLSGAWDEFKDGSIAKALRDGFGLWG